MIDKGRIKSSLAAMVIGDSLGSQSVYLNSLEMPAWLGRIRRELDEGMSSSGLTSYPKPFSLNQSNKLLLPAPTDFTDWAAWFAPLLLENNGKLNSEVLEKAWVDIAASEPELKCRISIRTALINLNRGLTAPECGRFNPHYFDDGALPRAIILGTVVNPERIIETARLDASFTQYGDGVHAAAALALAVNLAVSGKSLTDIIPAVLESLPEGTLAKRTVETAIEGTAELDLARTVHYLRTRVCNLEYSYGNVAAEILACALALIRNAGTDSDSCLAAASMLQGAGSLPPVTGALAGALYNDVSTEKLEAIIQTKLIEGNFIPAVAGTDIIRLIDDIARMGQ